MGFAASQGRLLMLVARKHDLELQLQFINQARLQLSQSMTRLFMAGANLEPGSEGANRIQFVTAAANAQEKQLDVLAQQFDSQLQAVNTEIDSVRKVISDNIQRSFKLNGQG